jgi:hypothetical protein
MKHLIDEGKVSPDELGELRRLLDEIDRDHDETNR